MTTHSFKVFLLLLTVILGVGFLVAIGWQYQESQKNREPEVLGVSVVNTTPMEVEMTIPASEVIELELPEVQSNKVNTEPAPTENVNSQPIYTNPVPKAEPVPEPAVQNPQPVPEIKEPEKKDEPAENPEGSGGWSQDLECYKANPHSYWDGFECVDPRV